jgi:hypothetical protein
MDNLKNMPALESRKAFWQNKAAQARSNPNQYAEILLVRAGIINHRS